MWAQFFIKAIKHCRKHLRLIPKTYSWPCVYSVCILSSCLFRMSSRLLGIQWSLATWACGRAAWRCKCWCLGLGMNSINDQWSVSSFLHMLRFQHRLGSRMLEKSAALETVIEIQARYVATHKRIHKVMLPMSKARGCGFIFPWKGSLPHISFFAILFARQLLGIGPIGTRCGTRVPTSTGHNLESSWHGNLVTSQEKIKEKDKKRKAKAPLMESIKVNTYQKHVFRKVSKTPRGIYRNLQLWSVPFLMFKDSRPQAYCVWHFVGPSCCQTLCKVAPLRWRLQSQKGKWRNRQWAMGCWVCGG